MTSEPIPPRAGQALGRYELLAPVARGGMGQVWAGRLRGARGFQKLVAIKTLLPAFEDRERMERMLFEEARIAGLIAHANVVQTMELGEHEGVLYLVMEWVDGEPLSFLIKACGEQGVPLSVAVNLVGQTLRGLQAAHELHDDDGTTLGVVHRDVSPHNVLVSYGGVAKLVDFGIAKAMNQERSSTTTGEIKGKFSYMAPEQILGQDVDQRADLFAVGIMLYLITTGQHPFKSHESAVVLHSITSEQPAPSPSRGNPDYPAALDRVVMKALQKNRDQRWASAAEMRAALQEAVPEAFAMGMERQVEAFMTQLVGERAALKREALRRVERRVDRASHQSGSLASAQSASSLRAVSIDDQTSDRDQPDSGAASSPASGSPVAVAPKSSVPRFARWAGVLAAGLLLAGAALMRHSPPASDAPLIHLAANSRGSSLSSLSPRASSEAPRPPAPAVSSVVSATPPLALSPQTAGRPQRPKPLPIWRKQATSRAKDLIAPEYAR